MCFICFTHGLRGLTTAEFRASIWHVNSPAARGSVVVAVDVFDLLHIDATVTFGYVWPLICYAEFSVFSSFAGARVRAVCCNFH